MKVIGTAVGYAASNTQSVSAYALGNETKGTTKVIGGAVGTLINPKKFATYPVVEGTTQVLPNTFYTFGEVDSLEVTLVESDDGRAYEYCFEFVPSDSFTELVVSPEPRWAVTPVIVPGGVCQVSILRGVGVMICAI